MITAHVRKAAGRRRRVQPTLERLEDRCVPASTTRTWTGNALMSDGLTPDPKWDAAANWRDLSGNAGAPEADDNLVFPSSSSNFDSTNNLADAIKFGQLQIEGNYTITGNSIELSNTTQPLVVKTVTGAITVDLPITFKGGSQVDVQNAAASLHLERAISGSAGLTKLGLGVLTLSAANTYSGATDIQAGTLQKGANVDVLPDSSTVTVADGATLNLAGFSEGVGALTGSGNVNLGPGDVILAIGANEQDTSFTGAISGNQIAGRRFSGAVHKVGARTWQLLGAIAADELRVANGTFVSDAHRLDDNIAVVVDAPALLVVGGEERIGSLAGAGEVILPHSARLFAGDNGADSEFSGIIRAGAGDSGAFSKEGAGIMTLAGGTLHAPAGLGIDNGTLRLTANNVISDATPVVVQATGTFDMENRTELLGSLDGLGEVKLGTGSLIVGLNNTSTTYAGVISGVGGAIAKRGSGVMTLTGQNTFTRGVFIDAGTLRLGADNVLHDSVPMGMLANTTFDMENRTEVIGSLSGAGEVKLGAGTLTTGNNEFVFFGGRIEGTGGLIKEGTGGWVLQDENDNDYSGPTLVKAGTLFVQNGSALGAADGTAATGTTVLNGAGLTLQASVGNEALILNGPGAFFGALDAEISSSFGGKVTLASTSTITVRNTNSRLTLSGGITGAGGLTKASPGTLVLAGASDYNGPTTVNQGTLEVNGSLSSAVTVNQQAMLSGTGTVGTVIMTEGSTLSPGASAGILRSGNVSLLANSVFRAELNGAAAGSGYDQLQVSGTVNLGGSTLNASLGFTPAVGARFTMIANDGSDAVQGTFKDLPEGRTTKIGGHSLRITYVGGDGNDVVLTRNASFIVTAPDAGAQPRVRVFDAETQQEKFNFLAYPPKFRGGVRVATADVNGDGFPDIITAPGPGTAALVKVFSGATQPGQVPQLLAMAKPYGNFKGGAFVAVGDVNGDRIPDLITGPGSGAAPAIKTLSAVNGALIGSFKAFPGNFKGGVTVAAGDVNGDGKLDIIAGMASRNKALVRVFDAATRTQLPGAIGSFLAYPSSFKGGVFVAAGDVSGDAAAEIITGAGPGATPLVRVFTPTTIAAPQSIVAYPPGQKRGVRVGSVDVNGDGKAEILAALGPKSSADVRIFNNVSTAAIDSFFAELPSFRRGLFVAGSLGD